jgi:hypothetical protein
MTETRYVDFDGHRLAYRMSGNGPALVVLNLYRRRQDMIQAGMLSATCQVFQVAPLGYGYSDRVPGYAGERLGEQVLRVLDHHGVDHFVVWGYSAGGAMTLCIAQSTRRAVGVVTGGFSPSHLRPGLLRQLDRRLDPDHPSRSLWWWFKEFDWTTELATMPCAQLFYWGSEDRQMAKQLRRLSGQLSLQAADFIEIAGLDHAECNTPLALESAVVPPVAEWLRQRVGPSW